MIQWKKCKILKICENWLISLKTFVSKTSNGRGVLFLRVEPIFFHFLSSSLHKVWPQTKDWVDLSTFNKIQPAYCRCGFWCLTFLWHFWYRFRVTMFLNRRQILQIYTYIFGIFAPPASTALGGLRRHLEHSPFSIPHILLTD